MAGAPEAKAVGEEFLARQREMYASGDLAAVEELLAEDVVWHVPGTSPIAGDYRGREVVRRTAGVYRVADGRIAEAWLVPLDQGHFHRVWGATCPAPFVYTLRVRPQECAASPCSATLASGHVAAFAEMLTGCTATGSTAGSPRSTPTTCLACIRSPAGCGVTTRRWPTG